MHSSNSLPGRSLDVAMRLSPKGRRPGHLGMKRSVHGVALRGFETDFAIALRVAFGGCVWL